MNRNDNTSLWFSHGRSAITSLKMLLDCYRQNKQTTINDRKNQMKWFNCTNKHNKTKPWQSKTKSKNKQKTFTFCLMHLCTISGRNVVKSACSTLICRRLFSQHIVVPNNRSYLYWCHLRWWLLLNFTYTHTHTHTHIHTYIQMYLSLDLSLIYVSSTFQKRL